VEPHISSQREKSPPTELRDLRQNKRRDALQKPTNTIQNKQAARRTEHHLATTILVLLAKNLQQIQHQRGMHLRAKDNKSGKRANMKPVNHLGRGKVIDFLENRDRRFLWD